MMNTNTLSSIAEEKQKIADRLVELERQEAELQAEQAQAAVDALIAVARYVTPKQAQAVMAAIGQGRKMATKRQPSAGAVAPKYWLPHSGETWTGRGRTPKAFTAWIGTAAYNDWKKAHPDEKFPAFPG